MRRYLDRPISEFHEEELVALLDELTHASGIDNRKTATHFVPFLILCMHPSGGNSPRLPLHPSRTRPGYLEMQVNRIQSGAIRELCRELIAAIYEPIQMHENKKLMTLFNFTVRVMEKKRKKPRSRGR
jgi:hypothetical protein